MPDQSVRAHAPGRILLSDPAIARIPKIKQILSAAGWTPHRKTPQRDDALALTAAAPARKTRAAWIGAAFIPDQPCPQEARPAPLGITIDTRGPIHDARHPSDLEMMLAKLPLDDATILARARHVADHLPMLKLCKNPTLCGQTELPNVPYVLVLDQPKDDETLPSEPVATNELREMLVLAHEAHPHANILIYSPNRDDAGPVEGHFDGADASPNITLFTEPANPWDLFELATAVYTLSSPLGFDAILAGHKPFVFGQPWYAGWGLTQDHTPIHRRTRQLTRTQLVAGALFHYCQWYDPKSKALCEIEHALAILEARNRAALEDQHGYVASNILRWKRPHMRRYFGQTAMTFSDDAAAITQQINLGRTHMAWGATASDAPVRIEDGFLRSRGLGAALVRPLSLIMDDTGIYFDPTHPSKLEALITKRAQLPDHARLRIEQFLTRLNAAKLSKYNVGHGCPPLPEGYKILVAGQVEDDASIKLGAGDINTNHALLMAARAAHPEAIIVFKPHPDVEAGLRRGKVENAHDIADVIAHEADPIALIDACDAVWTMTSLIGFEALIRDKPVTCTGAPFYAGWGLTTDLGNTPARRGAKPSILGLAHATLIDYPRYFDPTTGAALAPEQAIDVLLTAPNGRSKMAQSALAKLRQLRAQYLGLDR
ncbi:capsular polysaccharide biosynthesis protein [Pacificibacter marinus]|uniref:capsular polysaccharide biosynthesis protein n=1 Tax=Pacificibacter marinus TaxID=658057 RepID=UPI001C071BB5|nr:capsular polysaccharide biosynthesis protein [Pacificibacter marinus]